MQSLFSLLLITTICISKSHAIGVIDWLQQKFGDDHVCSRSVRAATLHPEQLPTMNAPEYLSLRTDGINRHRLALESLLPIPTMETEKLLLSTIEAEQPCEAIDYQTIPTVQLEQLSTTTGQEVLPLINQSSNSTQAFPTLQDSSDDDDWLCFEPTLSCYKVFFEPVTWLEAETKCRNNGTQLISIHSEQENEIIAGLIQGQKTSNASEDHTWIGLRITDYGENWTWSDGSSVDFLKWADGEPNNMLLDLEDNLPRELEHCVQLIVSDIEHFSDENNRHWNNYVCESTAPVFVCKKPFSRTE